MINSFLNYNIRDYRDHQIIEDKVSFLLNEKRKNILSTKVRFIRTHSMIFLIPNDKNKTTIITYRLSKRIHTELYNLNKDNDLFSFSKNFLSWKEKTLSSLKREIEENFKEKKDLKKSLSLIEKTISFGNLYNYNVFYKYILKYFDLNTGILNTNFQNIRILYRTEFNNFVREKSIKQEPGLSKIDNVLSCSSIYAKLNIHNYLNSKGTITPFLYSYYYSQYIYNGYFPYDQEKFNSINIKKEYKTDLFYLFKSCFFKGPLKKMFFYRYDIDYKEFPIEILDGFYFFFLKIHNSPSYNIYSQLRRFMKNKKAILFIGEIFQSKFETEIFLKIIEKKGAAFTKKYFFKLYLIRRFYLSDSNKKNDPDYYADLFYQSRSKLIEMIKNA